jgi:hypothetical protein
MLPAVAVTPAVTNCGSASIGPGSVRQSSGDGPRCLVAAYRDGCRPATFRLSRFGVDTIATKSFRIVSRNSRCVVAVTETLRVVPQPAHVTAQGVCTGLRATAATSCSGRGLSRTISLTS